MAGLQTNLNVAPFYDDYNEDKQYYRILFRPSTAVQARELTQIQTIMQKQISRFGDSIYKDGSIVEGCNFTQYPNLAQVKFKDSNTTTYDFTLLTVGNYDPTANISHLSNSPLLVSNTSGLRAAIFEANPGAESTISSGIPDTNRAYVLYLNTGYVSSNPVSTFSTTSEQIDVYGPNQSKQGILNPANFLGSIYTLSSNSSVNALGVGYGIHIGEGIIYQKGFFLNTKPGNFVIKEHSSNVFGIKVGFSTSEYIVKPVEDTSLYDNSIGSPNYSAPGAYRLKLVPSLVSYDSSNNSVTIPTGFLAIIDYSGTAKNQAVITAKDPIYSIVGDMIAQRTKEEAGDYIVKPFQINVESSGNPNTFYYTASPGIGYIDGYRVEYQSTRRIEVPRGVNSQDLIGQRTTVNFGNYIIVNEVSGIFDIGGMVSVGIYDVPQKVISENLSASAPLGDLIGTATIRSFQYNSGTKGTGSIGSETYRLYITNINMNPGYNFQSGAKSFYVNGTYGKVFADIVLNGGYAQLSGSKGNLIFNTGLSGLKRLTSNTGVNNTSYIYRSTLDPATLSSSGTSASATFTLSADQFNYGVGSIGDIQSSEINIFFNSNVTANIFPSIVFGGSIGGTSNTTCSNLTVSSITAGFDTFLKPGNSLKLASTASGTTYHVIKKINSANSLTISPPVSPTPSAGSIYIHRFFKAGTQIDFTGSGNTISFSSTSGKVQQMTVHVGINLDGVNSNTLRAQVPIARTTATPIGLDVHKDVYVAINCASHPAGSTGPWTLGIPDVYKVSSIYVGANFANTNPDRVGWFKFNNGQTDNYYGLSYISILPNYQSGITSQSNILVRLNHFSPNITSTMATFTSVDSYPINDSNPTNPSYIATAEIPVYNDISNGIYDLRNYIDVRPFVTNTAISATNPANATINPANNTSQFYSAALKVAIEPDSIFEYNAEFYLPRYDALLITKDGSLIVKSGTPSFNPKQPSINSSGLKVADILVPPYPSLTFSEAE